MIASEINSMKVALSFIKKQVCNETNRENRKQVVIKIAAKKKRIDVLLHRFVPRHLLLSKEESQDLLEKYKIDLTDLPQMFEKDPVAIAIGAKEGDIVKIIRDS